MLSTKPGPTFVCTRIANPMICWVRPGSWVRVIPASLLVFVYQRLISAFGLVDGIK